MEDTKYHRPTNYTEQIKTIRLLKNKFDLLLKEILGPNISSKLILHNVEPPQYNDLKHFNFKKIETRILTVDDLNYFVIPANHAEKTIGGFSAHNEKPKDDDILVKYNEL